MKLQFDDAVADALGQALAELDFVDLVYAFGSRVGGSPRAESDLDLAVLVGRGVDRYEALQRILAEAGRIFPSTHLDVVLLGDASPLLKHRVLRDGRLLFERKPPLRVRFQTAALAEYFDLESQRRFFYGARKAAIQRRQIDGGSGNLLAQARRLGRLLGPAEGVPSGPGG